MSFAFIVVMMLLGSSVVIAFVLQPSKEEPARTSNSPVIHHRCQGRSLQSIRKELLGALNLQIEPRLPAQLDGIREQWRTTLSTLPHRAKDTAVPAASGYTVSPDVANSTSLKCCSVASEIFMKDLGWDSWVILPASVTFVQCAPCNSEGNAVQCPSSHTNVQDADSQEVNQLPKDKPVFSFCQHKYTKCTKYKVPCCKPIQEKVPVLYVDEFGTMVISFMQLTSSCGCAPGDLQLPSTE